MHICAFLLKMGVIALGLCPSSFGPLPHCAFFLLSPARCNEFSVPKRPLSNHFRERCVVVLKITEETSKGLQKHPQPGNGCRDQSLSLTEVGNSFPGAHRSLEEAVAQP